MMSAAGFNVAIHIGEPDDIDKDAGMRRFLLRAAVGCAALVAGVVIGSVHQHLLHKRQSANVDQTAPANLPAQLSEGAELPPEDESYPADEGLTPWDIEFFIDQHPNANLTPLFERLNVRGFGAYPGDSSYWQCTNCKAQSFEYNLDDDEHGEVVLRITNRMMESYRYLVFKERAYNDVKFLGHIDVWGKYRPSTHAVLLSGGKQWLVVEGQAASGSGLSAYLHTIYEVSNRGVKPAVSYLSEINQAGFDRFPAKKVFAQPVSCEIAAGRMKATVSYTVRYFGRDDEDAKGLFTKQQTAVLTAVVGRDSTNLIASASNITPHEFETIFNFDSMGDDEFLQYNRSELRSIAVGRDRSKKKWLKEYLEICESRKSIKRELLSLLR